MNEKFISSMIKNLHAVESEGLSYAISEGYIDGDTSDEVFDKAVKDASEAIEVINSKLQEFENELETGKYDRYLK